MACLLRYGKSPSELRTFFAYPLVLNTSLSDFRPVLPVQEEEP
jgi:hypothetical protein